MGIPRIRSRPSAVAAAVLLGAALAAAASAGSTAGSGAASAPYAAPDSGRPPGPASAEQLLRWSANVLGAARAQFEQLGPELAALAAAQERLQQSPSSREARTGLREECERLERRAAALDAQAEGLAGHAAALAAQLGGGPRPQPPAVESR
jgi:hypothetical protein